jgi:hypothetical protein
MAFCYSFKSEHSFRKVPNTSAAYTLIAMLGQLRPNTLGKEGRRLNSASHSSVPHCGIFDSLCVCWVGARQDELLVSLDQLTKTD